MKRKEKWFYHGDIDGFFGLFIDNLIQLMLISVLCRYACGFPLELITERILPGVGLSIFVGNLFYAWQARKLALSNPEKKVTALPFGINTVSLLAFIFLVMSPVYNETGDANLAWQAGLGACLVSGVIETLGAFVGTWIKRHTPRAALLSGLGGVALSFIVLGFSFQIFSTPAFSLIPMMLVLFFYASKIRLPFHLPSGAMAMLIGGILAWCLKWMGFLDFTLLQEPMALSLNVPIPAFSEIFASLQGPTGWQMISVVIPVALFNVIGSIQNLESAEAAGDSFDTQPTLLVNGLTSLLACGFGAPFPTSLYIGHPGWKSMGARTGYSILNGVAIALVCMTGGINLILKMIPMEGALGILIWIGLVIVAEATTKTEAKHGVAVALGLVPAFAAWVLSIIETTLRVAGTDLYTVIDQFKGELAIQGILSLYQGFLLISIVLSAILAHVIDRQFLKAAWWSFSGALFSSVGLIHAYQLTPSGLHTSLGWLTAPWFTFAYGFLGVTLLVMSRLSPKQFEPSNL
ncbi:MAG: hypothetical protein KCHDKBKB_01786 [Elusimicrobia bacterium]|nr:hypothetical protein [Elusimicrobiota bacterium]